MTYLSGDIYEIIARKRANGRCDGRLGCERCPEMEGQLAKFFKGKVVLTAYRKKIKPRKYPNASEEADKIQILCRTCAIKEINTQPLKPRPRKIDKDQVDMFEKTK